jgi:hypothetical protein
MDLREAYLSVYNLDEGIGSAIKGFLRRNKKQPEAPKPMSRGEFLRKRYNVGPERSDTSAKRQILDRSRANIGRAQRQVDIGNASQSYADKAEASHDRYLRAGYSKYGADDARGRGNKARKRAEALNREEFEFWINDLIEEGYDLSSYTLNEMYDLYEENMQKSPRNVAKVKKKSQERKDRRARIRYYGKDAVGHGTGEHLKPSQNETYDFYDVVLSHLIDEGYAETPEAAEAIMVNMSEEWIEDIVGEYVD